MNQPTVYCIIVTFNGMQWIEKCLLTILSGSYKCRIIVVDNGSTDGTVSFIKNRFPSIHLIETGANLGFGKANNIGLQIALEDDADHIFLLNQDTWIESDTIELLVKAQKQNPEYGIISSVHLNGSGSDFDKDFYFYLTRSDIKNVFHDFIDGKTNPQLLINSPFVNAAAWLISHKCLVKTGGFDPIFYHYGEDDNYVHRVLHHGFKTGILLSSKIYHDRKPALQGSAQNIRVAFEKDWLNLLVHVCNVQQKNFKPVLRKRFVRHFCMFILSAIQVKKDQSFYHASMAKNILRYWPEIKRSHRIVLSEDCPYLSSNFKKVKHPSRLNKKELVF